MYFECPECEFHLGTLVSESDFPINCRCGLRCEWPEGVTDKPPSQPPRPFVPSDRSATNHAFIAGPGTELGKIFQSAGARSDQCGGMCEVWIRKMNEWGVVGCRENRGKIIRRIRKAMYRTWVTDQAKIGWSIAREPWFKISDPVGCIVDESIRRAENSLP